MKPKHIIFRSKGCRTCRARKVKCDEARPICQRCIRSRFECQGYGEPTTFLSDNPRPQDTSPTDLSKSIRASQAQPVYAVPQALPYPAELTYVGFLVSRLCIGTPGDSRDFSWLRPGLESPDQNSLFYVTSRCLAEVYYGRVFRQEGVVTKGITKYGSILGHLRQQLQVPELFHVNGLMSVIMVAVVIESVANQSAAGFHAHVRGLAQLVQRAGPEAFMRRPNILIFETCRSWIVRSAIISKHETFVAAPEWKTIPWTYEKKGAIRKLWDIM
jgi:Fungal Zn(2)-Cys(6) binuclear cluster domain